MTQKEKLADKKKMEREWSEEIARRIPDLDSGKAKTIPWENVRRRINTN